MINPQWLKLPMSRTNFHGPKGVQPLKSNFTTDVNGLLTEKAAIISGSCNKALMSGIPPAPAAPPEEIVQIHETLIVSNTDNSNYYLNLALLVLDMPLSLQTIQIQISWLLQKPTDLALHCLSFRI